MLRLLFLKNIDVEAMTDNIGVGLFERLSLRKWYRYLLYVSGILLVLSSFLNTQIEQSKIIGFSMLTIVISILVWLSDTALEAYFDYYEHERRVNDNKHISDEEKYAQVASIAINFFFFFIWAILATPKLF